MKLSNLVTCNELLPNTVSTGFTGHLRVICSGIGLHWLRYMLSFTKRKGRHICSRIILLWSHCMQSINAKNTFRVFWYGAPSTLDIFWGIVVLNKNGLSVSSPTLNTPGADVMHSNHCSMLFCPLNLKQSPSSSSNTDPTNLNSVLAFTFCFQESVWLRWRSGLLKWKNLQESFMTTASLLHVKTWGIEKTGWD